MFRVNTSLFSFQGVGAESYQLAISQQITATPIQSWRHEGIWQWYWHLRGTCILFCHFVHVFPFHNVVLFVPSRWSSRGIHPSHVWFLCCVELHLRCGDHHIVVSVTQKKCGSTTFFLCVWNYYIFCVLLFFFLFFFTIYYSKMCFHLPYAYNEMDTCHMVKGGQVQLSDSSWIF